MEDTPLKGALDALEHSLMKDRPRAESLSLLAQVRASISESKALPSSAATFRASDDRQRYQSAGGGITDPLLGLEAALHKHYTNTFLSQESTGVSPFITEILNEAHPIVNESSAARNIGTITSEHVTTEVQSVSPSQSPSRKLDVVSTAAREPITDRRDQETPFPYHRLSGANCSSHATLLERLYGILRFGSGNTSVILLDTMNGDTQAAVLSESEELGARCFPFADRLVRELPTRIEICETALPKEATWEHEVRTHKEQERARRYPLLVSNGNRLPDIDPRVDFAVDRPRGILEDLSSLIGGSVVCKSGCNLATSTQFIPPAKGHSCKPFVTSDVIEISIAPWACSVTSYALASVWSITGGSPPRNWVLEARHGNGPWITLREHVADETISNVKNFAVWDVTEGLQTVVVNHFRIRRTGCDARNGSSLQIAGVELYGRFMCCWPSGLANATTSSNAYQSIPATDVPLTQFIIPPFIALPTEPAPKNAKKKKK